MDTIGKMTGAAALVTILAVALTIADRWYTERARRTGRAPREWRG